jgi:hypothetical protein
VPRAFQENDSMALTADQLKAKRLQAMSVVGTQAQSTADMYDRVIAAGEVVAKARGLAETAHMDALSSQIADLKEMTEELQGFEQAAPLANGTANGAAAPPVTPRPVTASAVPPALAALQAAVPNPSADAWKEGNAYVGTTPKAQPSTS